MSFDRNQFENLICATLEAVGLCSDSAVNLLLGTAAQESAFGTYLRQISGPALGVFQMEKPTFEWLQEEYDDFARIDQMVKAGWSKALLNIPHIVEHGDFEDLEYDLRLAIIFARLRYLIVPHALPAADDLQALALYWKRWYNSEAGKGTVEEFIGNYRHYVEGRNDD